MNLKLFGRNALIYGFGTIFSHGAAFLLIPIYTHSLSMSEYGLLSTLFVTSQFMLILMNLGMRISLVRFATEYEDNNLMGRLLGTSILINLAGGVIMTYISLSFLLPFFRHVLHTDDVRGLIMLTCLSSLMQSLFIHIISYYRAKNEALKFMYANISAAGLMIVSTILFIIVFDFGPKGVLAAQVIAYGAIFYFVLFSLIIKNNMGVSFRLMGRLFQFGFPLIAPQTAQSFMGASTMYLLSYFANLEAVAIFSLGQKLAQIFSIILITPYQLAFQPFIFANLNKPGIKESMSRIFTYFILAAAFVALALLLGIRLVFPWIAPPNYSPAYLLIVLLLPMMVVTGVGHFGESLLNIVQKTYLTGIVIAVCVAISLVLNYTLIPILSWYGAVISLNVSNILIGLFLLVIGLGAFPITLEWRRIAIAVGLLISFLMLSFVVYQKTSVIFYGTTMILALAMGVFLYWANFFNDREKTFIKSALQGRYLRALIK